MPRADAPRERIGEMLLSLGLITRAQLDQAVDAQGSTKLRLGKQLVALSYVSETRLTQVLSNQLSVPWVSLERVDFPAELLGRVPAEIADAHSLVPVYVRSVRGKGATLYVAMDDPTDDGVLQKVAAIVGLPVRPMIAPPSEIRRVIEQRYFAGGAAAGFAEESTGLRSLPDRGAKLFAQAATEPTSAPKPPAKVRRPPPPPGPAAARAEAIVPVEQYDTPSQPPPASNRTLTLLDGTQITLPSARGAQTSPEIRAVQHVIKAIRAARSELGEEDPLRWHDIVHAVLDSLDARGVRLTRKEVSDAWLRVRTKRAQPKAQ